MSKPIVRCRCGHRVQGKEVLRTDLYERSSGRSFIYVKFRCGWCKRLGDAFVPEQQWDWSSFEPARDEMSEAERCQAARRDAISTAEVLDFHRYLEEMDSGRLDEELFGPVEPQRNASRHNIAHSHPHNASSSHGQGQADVTKIDTATDANAAKNHRNSRTRRTRSSGNDSASGDLPSSTS